MKRKGYRRCRDGYNANRLSLSRHYEERTTEVEGRLFSNLEIRHSLIVVLAIGRATTLGDRGWMAIRQLNHNLAKQASMLKP